MNYRNKKDLISLEGIEVEAGSLWKFKPDLELLVLEDEDQFASYQLDSRKFEEA